MKKIIYLFILMISFAEAQIIIPNASQQPMWAFPLYIEDSIGQKDTIYFGYDANATYSYLNTDIQFGEYHYARDTSMQAYLGSYTYPGNVDSIVKIDIRDTLNINQFNIFFLVVDGAYPPLKLKYNSDLLYSDSINYPDKDPAPRAQIELFTNYFYNLPPCPLFSNEDVLITDTVSSICQPNCYFSDSLYFNHILPNKSTFYFYIFFFKWSGCPQNPGRVDELSIHDWISFLPNPADNYIDFKTEIDISWVEIYSINGLKLKQIKTDIEKRIFLKELNDGIYFMKFYSQNKVIVKKLIVNH